MKTCKAIQYSDMMECEPCGLKWDTNDYAPPACNYERLTQIEDTAREWNWPGIAAATVKYTAFALWWACAVPLAFMFTYYVWVGFLRTLRELF